jgi:hypothetical protein
MMKRVATFVLLVCVLGMANAQEVVTLTQGKNIRAAKVTPTYRPTYSGIRLAIGGPRLIAVEYNRWLKPWLMVGAGTGYGMVNCTLSEYIPAFTDSYGYAHGEVDYSGWKVGYGVPWYIEAEVRTPKYKWSLFFNAKIGYSFGVRKPNLYADLPLGRNFYMTDDNGYAVFSTTTLTWHPFFVDALLGFGYKRFSMGVGAGVHGGYRMVNIMFSFDFPFK